MEESAEIPTAYNKVRNPSETSNRKDLGYSSEVNSCDSGPEVLSLQEDAMPDFIDETDGLSVLKMELHKTKVELEQKSRECDQLQVIRNKVEGEIEDLTTSLFEEANKMVYEANLKRNKAEKKLAAAEGKIDALEIEIDALKALVITSTPSNPNPNSHPQLIKKPESSPIRMKLHKNRIVFEREKEKPDSPKREAKMGEFKLARPSCQPMPVYKLHKDVNNWLFQELSSWHRHTTNSLDASLDVSSTYCDCFVLSFDVKEAQCFPLKECKMIKDSEFLRRIFDEDVSLCLNFRNQELSRKVSHCIHRNSLCVELATNNDSLAQSCALSETAAACKHRIRLADTDEWFSISPTARNKVTSICNFFTYLRYVRQGIVKHDAEQMYWKILNLRTEMVFARLGYYKEQP